VVSWKNVFAFFAMFSYFFIMSGVIMARCMIPTCNTDIYLDWQCAMKGVFLVVLLPIVTLPVAVIAIKKLKERENND